MKKKKKKKKIIENIVHIFLQDLYHTLEWRCRRMLTSWRRWISMHIASRSHGPGYFQVIKIPMILIIDLNKWVLMLKKIYWIVFALLRCYRRWSGKGKLGRCGILQQIDKLHAKERYAACPSQKARSIWFSSSWIDHNYWSYVSMIHQALHPMQISITTTSQKHSRSSTMVC